MSTRNASKQDEKYLKEFFKGQIFHASVQSKSKGVPIGIVHHNKFKAEKVTVQAEGRYVIIKGVFDSNRTIIVNIYAPNNWCECHNVVS